MVSEIKKLQVKKLAEMIEKYPVIGLIDLLKMPSRQLQAIRKDLRGEVEIKMVKKRLIGHTIKEVKKKELEKLVGIDAKEPAIIFSNENPFKLYKLLEQRKSATFAKEGDVAPRDIIIPEGPTKLAAGPAIGELQRAKIPAMVKEGKIHVSKDTTIVKKDGAITAEIADILRKLGIQPIEIGINILAVWEDGFIYEKDVLAVSTEEYIKRILQAHSYAFNLSVNTGYPTKDSIKLMLQKAFLNAKTLGLNTGIIEDLLVMSKTQAELLKGEVGG